MILKKTRRFNIQILSYVYKNDFKYDFKDFYSYHEHFIKISTKVLKT